MNIYGFNFNTPIDHFDDLGHQSRTQRNANRNARNQANQEGRRNNQNRRTTDRISENANRRNETGQTIMDDLTDIIAGRGPLHAGARRVAKARCDEQFESGDYTEGCACCLVHLEGGRPLQGGSDGVKSWFVASAYVVGKKCEDAEFSSGPGMRNQNFPNGSQDYEEDKYKISY